jgi:hypothetical protein
MSIGGFNKDIVFLGFFPGWAVIPVMSTIPIQNFNLFLISFLILPISALMMWKGIYPASSFRAFSSLVLGGKRYNRSPWREK